MAPGEAGPRPLLRRTELRGPGPRRRSVLRKNCSSKAFLSAAGSASISPLRTHPTRPLPATLYLPTAASAAPPPSPDPPLYPPPNSPSGQSTNIFHIQRRRSCGLSVRHAAGLISRKNYLEPLVSIWGGRFSAPPQGPPLPSLLPHPPTTTTQSILIIIGCAAAAAAPG